MAMASTGAKAMSRGKVSRVSVDGRRRTCLQKKAKEENRLGSNIMVFSPRPQLVT